MASSTISKKGYNNLQSPNLNNCISTYMGYVSGGTNTPTSNGDGYLIVVGSDTADRCMQMWKVRSSSDIWHRYLLGGNWSAWIKLANVQ